MGRFGEDPGLLWTEKMILVIAMYRLEQWVKGSIVILLLVDPRLLSVSVLSSRSGDQSQDLRVS
jgi:hypothetical protein